MRESAKSMAPRGPAAGWQRGFMKMLERRYLGLCLHSLYLANLLRYPKARRKKQDVKEQMMAGPYTKTGRISDVLALIQVLALDEHTHRSESGLTSELQGKPASASSWLTLGKEHPEFFRVRTDGENSRADKEHALSLVARHVMPRNEQGRRQLPSEMIHRLLETAIDLHDRQMSVAERWKNFVPLWAALIGGIFGTFSALITLWFKGCPK